MICRQKRWLGQWMGLTNDWRLTWLVRWWSDDGKCWRNGPGWSHARMRDRQFRFNVWRSGYSNCTNDNHRIQFDNYWVINHNDRLLIYIDIFKAYEYTTHMCYLILRTLYQTSSAKASIQLLFNISWNIIVLHIVNNIAMPFRPVCQLTPFQHFWPWVQKWGFTTRIVGKARFWCFISCVPLWKNQLIYH